MKYVIKIILLFLISKPGIAEKSAVRIIGGRNATAGEFPYIMELMFLRRLSRKWQRYCSGSVIAASWSLTAGHCDIGLAETAIKFNNKIALIFNFIPHPKFRFFKYNKKDVIFNDVALVKHNFVYLKEYGRVSAIEYSALYGEEATIAGYGASETTLKKRFDKYTIDKGIPHFTYKFPKGLMVLDGLIVKCDENIYFQVLPQICVVASCDGKPKIRLTGPADSGSPLIHASGIVGVLSSGHPGVLQGQAHAGYYVPTSHILQWIRNEVKADIITP